MRYIEKLDYLLLIPQLLHAMQALNGLVITAYLHYTANYTCSFIMLLWIAIGIIRDMGVSRPSFI